VEYQRETVEGIQIEILPLLQEHYREIAPHQDIVLDPDFEHYLAADRSGYLRIFTARESGGALVGYACFYLKSHPHFKRSRQATLDLLYVDPDFRGCGHEFLRYIESQLAGEGAELIHLHVTTQYDYSPLLKRMGYSVSETTHSKRVRE
jgi:GNAT superfamily N-acetyltransferase